MARRVDGNPSVIQSQGKLTNPGTSTTLADSGALDAGIYEARILIGCSVAATFVVQRRDSTNANNVGDVPVLYGAAGQTGQYMLTFTLLQGERFRVLPESAITGTAAAILNIERLI